VTLIRDRAMRDFGLTYGPRAKPRWWLGEREPISAGAAEERPTQGPATRPH
jgi:hypothetical protein